MLCTGHRVLLYHNSLCWYWWAMAINAIILIWDHCHELQQSNYAIKGHWHKGFNWGSFLTQTGASKNISLHWRSREREVNSEWRQIKNFLSVHHKGRDGWDWINRGGCIVLIWGEFLPCFSMRWSQRRSHSINNLHEACFASEGRPYINTISVGSRLFNCL